MPGRLSPSEDVLLRDFVGRLLAAAPAGAIAAIRVFGSRARGESGPNSDLDVAVLLREGADPAPLRRLATDAAFDAMEARDAQDLALAPLVLPPGPPTGVRAAIIRDGLTVWSAAAPVASPW